MPRRFGVTIDCRDPRALAAFWRLVLDFEDEPSPEGYPNWAEYDSAHGVSAEDAEAGHTIIDPTGSGPRIYFQEVPDAKLVKNRVHLDVVASPTHEWPEVLSTADRIAANGGCVVGESNDPDDRFIVMMDPEGNEFCLVL
jgi:hypothetical protein